MTHSITISGNTTLGVEHSGMRIVVDAAAVITLPHEDTYKFIEGDEFEVISNTTSNVSVVGATGVTVIPLSSALITTKGASVKIEYQGDNVYLMWGAL